MKPKTPVIRSKKWFYRSFRLKVPMRTNSAEVLKAGTMVTTTGELTESRWFVCVTYPVIYRHGVMRLEAWLRRKDLLNPALVLPVSDAVLKLAKLAKRIRELRNFCRADKDLVKVFKSLARPS